MYNRVFLYGVFSRCSGCTPTFKIPLYKCKEFLKRKLFFTHNLRKVRIRSSEGQIFNQMCYQQLLLTDATGMWHSSWGSPRARFSDKIRFSTRPLYTSLLFHQWGSPWGETGSKANSSARPHSQGRNEVHKNTSRNSGNTRLSSRLCSYRWGFCFLKPLCMCLSVCPSVCKQPCVQMHIWRLEDDFCKLVHCGIQTVSADHKICAPSSFAC